MHAKATRIQQLLRELGAAGTVRELPDSTHTAAAAAAAVGTTVAQIAKSLVFTTGEQPVLVIASGAHRVDIDRVSRHIGDPVKPLDAKSVKQVTGFSVGGVPPIGHDTRLRTLIDQTLFDYDEIWAAAGTPHAVFPTNAEELARMTSGEIAEIAEVG